MVRKREDGRWEGRIVVGHKENSDPIFRYIYAETQKELTRKLRQSIEAYQGVELTEESRMTLGQWLDQWLGNMTGTIRPITMKRYEGTVARHIKPYLGEKIISKVTGKDIQKLYDTLAHHGNRNAGEGLPAERSGVSTRCSMKRWEQRSRLASSHVIPPKISTYSNSATKGKRC